MSQAIDPFFDTLRGLGSPDELTAQALSPAARPRVNAHIHLPPNFSAFETTEQAVALAQAQDVRVLGASNYYDYTVYGEFAAQAQARGIFPLFGLETIVLMGELVREGVKINDPGNPGKMYLCGKGITRFDPMTPQAQALLQTIRDNDAARAAAVTEKLAIVFAHAGLTTGLTADAIKERVAQRHQCPPETVYLQERHIAQAFQEALFEGVSEAQRAGVLERAYGTAPKADRTDAVAVQNELRAQLLKAGKAAYVAETFVGFDHAYQLILALGGIPCYPVLADGTSPLTEYEADPRQLASDLKARGIPCAELIPNRNAPNVLSRYVHALRDAGLFVTAGTEHNTLDLLPLEPVCVGGVPVPDDVQEIFWEGACVVAAHQYLATQGGTGYVNAQGLPNTAYTSAEERIAAFRALGSQVIGRYGKTTWETA